MTCSSSRGHLVALGSKTNETSVSRGGAGCLGVPAACCCIVCADVGICMGQTVISKVMFIFIAALAPRLLPQLLLMTCTRCHPPVEPPSRPTQAAVFQCQSSYFFLLRRHVNLLRRRKYFCDLVYKWGLSL